MSDQPPPPPPHGGSGGGSKSGGLPPGKYDIFVIPEHSAGSGFLYLPSLQPNINSFVAGFASALILVVLGQSMAPAFRTWWDSFQGLGNMGIVMLIMGVGFGAWALGRTQQDGGTSFGSNFRPKPDASSGSGGSGGFAGAHPGTSHNADGPPPPPPPHGSNQGGHHQSSGPNGGPPPHGARQHADDYYPTGNTPPPHQNTPPPPQEEKPKPPPPKPEPKKETPKSSWEKARDQYRGSWEKAREETRKKEEERKAKEAEQKRREETARRLAELRAKEAKERQQREVEKQKREKEAKEAKEKEERQKADQRAKELSEKLERERKERERAEKEAKEREEKKRKEEEEARSKKGSSYAFSGVGEKMSMWPNGKPPAPKHTPTPSQASRNPPSPERKPPAPTAKTYMSEETHSYRPYDKPKPARKKSVSSFAGSESSWAPSQTTTRTSPPPSMRGPYSTRDPDKIMISAVYLFMNQFAKTPASQLISGIRPVTDGLILRITSEGLFIDDDVRGVPQREWDVKAWTLKQVEVWCPPHCLNSSSSASSASSRSSPNLLHKMAQSRARNADRGATKALTGEEADVYLAEMLRACNDCCRLGLCERSFKDTNIPSSTGQTGEWKSKGLHVLRATLRDQEAKRYLFVIDEAESWKVAAGLQRLRRGTQVRQLGVSGMSPPEARGTLEMLGWGN